MALVHHYPNQQLRARASSSSWGGSFLTRNTCSRWRFHNNNVRTVHGSPYTFSVKPKWRTVVFWFFAARSSAEAYFRSSPPRGHSTVGVPMRCEGFVAIWLRAREDIAHNRFQHLFINIDIYIIINIYIYIFLATVKSGHQVCNNYRTLPIIPQACLLV